MSRLDHVRLYTLVVTYRSEASEMLKAFRAHDVGHAYRLAKDAGYSPIAIWCVN
jgi:hypothetical protein